MAPEIGPKCVGGFENLTPAVRFPKPRKTFHVFFKSVF